MNPLTFKIRGGVDVDSKGKAAGKGLLIQENMASTLAVSQDQYVFAVENHPADSRCDIDDSGTIQTLTGRMGTGGNNTPMIMFSKSARGSADDATTWKESQITNTLTTFDLGEVRTNEIVTYCIGNGQSDLVNHIQGYIVRRLTPLECCRLQGFPDGWADIDHKYKFSDEDYEFWSSIHSGTREQVRRWYNKLHTDTSEYKMWGNGIALPCALYVFEGIEEEIRLAHESPDVAND